MILLGLGGLVCKDEMRVEVIFNHIHNVYQLLKAAKETFITYHYLLLVVDKYLEYRRYIVKHKTINRSINISLSSGIVKEYPRPNRFQYIKLVSDYSIFPLSIMT